MAGTHGDERSLEGINDELYQRGATDGLPVVPPTDELVEEMLRGTDLDPDLELATVGERDGSLSVEKLAVNAVMAGCAPIHMPVLIAGVRAMSDPTVKVDQAMIDPGSWSLQWIINGPVRGDLDIRTDTGAFGPGFRSNRTIGRALGLAYQNTALIHPGTGGSDLTGTPFKNTLVAGENEERSPWEPHHVSTGYDRDDSTITLSVRRSFIQFIPYGMDVDGILRAMQYNTIPDMTGASAGDSEQTIVHTVAPYNAEELGEAGLSKWDVKEYLAENSILPYDEVGPAIEGVKQEGPGVATPLQAAQIESPEHVQIYVVGGSGRFNALGHAMAGPVTEQIEFPEEWDSLLEEYSVEREWGGITEEYDEGEK